jgi:hypothetical protein
MTYESIVKIGKTTKWVIIIPPFSSLIKNYVGISLDNYAWMGKLTNWTGEDLNPLGGETNSGFGGI